MFLERVDKMTGKIRDNVVFEGVYVCISFFSYKKTEAKPICLYFY